MSAAAQPARKPAKASAYPTTWPGTTIVKSLHTPFNWRTQPAAIPTAKQLMKRGPKKMRDNTVSNFSTPIPTLADADKQRRIKASAGARA